MERRQILKSAWNLARSGQARFGGSAREYFSQALKIIWQESRKPVERPRAVWQPELGMARYVLPGVAAPSIPVKAGQQLWLQMEQ